MKTTTDIDVAIRILTEAIRQAASKDSQIQSPSRPCILITSLIQQLLAVKKRTRAQWERTKYPRDKAFYNRPTLELTKAERAGCIESKLLTLSPISGSLWKKLRLYLNQARTYRHLK